ncbi:MAG: hypothetical protein EOM18_11100, partial [Clostridia bacterium]|nr:hypothetical protein [Clostridia bacterium]
MPDGNVTLSATFETAPATAATTPTTNSSSQATGALAVSIVKNNNKAYIDTTKEVKANGNVILTAKANTSSVTVANATAVTEASVGQTTPVDPVTGETVGANDEITHAQTHGIVSIPATTNGSILFQSANEQPAAGEKVTVKVTPRQGYRMSAGSLKYTYETPAPTQGAPNVIQNGTLEFDNNTGNYYFTIPTGIAAGTSIIILAAFEADGHTAVITTAEHGTLTKKVTDNTAGQTPTFTFTSLTGDTVILEAAPENGYKVSDLYYYETPAAGTPVTGKPAGAVSIVKNEDGTYSFVMPAKDITIKIVFEEKALKIVTVGDVTVSTPFGETGETITVAAPNVSQNPGSVTVSYGYLEFGDGDFHYEGTITYDAATKSFIIPTGITFEDGTVIQVEAGQAAADKQYQVTVDTAITNGVVTAPMKVDSGDVMNLTVTPNNGYILQDNSLKVTVTKGSGATAESEVHVVTKDAQGAYKFTVPAITGTLPITISITAAFVQGTTGTTPGTAKKALSLGVAVTVAVTKHVNQAYIKNGKISADGLMITADSGTKAAPVTSIAQSYAGYSTGNIGIGGAISVHVANAKTKAVVLKNTVLTLTDAAAVKLGASSFERFETTADASKADKAGSIGVGAGIAVAVTGIDVISGIDDGTVIYGKTSYTDTAKKDEVKLSDLEVTAEHSGREIISAKAGSAGGISITPVLALGVSGVRTEAYIGNAASTQPKASFTVSGDVKVSADNLMTREVAANAAAAGGNVGFGAAPVITVINDSARASVKRNLKANNIKVNAVSKSTLKSTSRAGANGATASPSQGGTITSGTQDPDPHPAGSERGQSDQQADRSIQGAGKIAGSNGSSNVNPGTISNLSGNRQTAQTSEGNIQIAAAFNLNIMKNIAAAYITGNLVIEAVKDLIITSVNLTEAKIYANASATQSKIGVGAAVAINIVTYENLAYVDQAKVKAENLTIKATMPEAAATTTPSAPVQENIVRDTVEKVIKDALNELTEQMGLSTIFGEENSQALTNMLSELLGEITGKAAQTLLTGTGLEQLLNNDVMTKLEERFNALPSTFEAWLKTCPQGTKTALINVLKTAVLQNVLNMLAQRAQSWLTPAGQTPGQGSPSVANPTAPVTLGADLQKLGLDTKTALGQEMLLMATNLSQNLFEGLINVNTLKTYLAGDIVADLRTKAAKILQDTGRALSTAALDSLSSWLDLSIKQKDKGPTHTFVTQAIAGAGASNVGVAGSVAISVVSGKTKAYIGDSAQTVVVEKDMIIQADASQSEDTTSSAAVGSDGKADKNLAAGSADTTSGSSDITHQGSTNGNLVIAPSTNGAVTASKNGNKVTVTGSPDEGYTLGYVTAAVTSTGTEITVLKNANGTYEFTIPTTLAAGETITISSVFVADLKDIVIRPLKITTGTATAVDSTVGSIFVITDSTPAESSTFSKAKMNDRVVVRVVPKTGYRLKEGSLQFVYTINNQEYVKKIVVVENPNTNAYVFYMPDAIVSVEAIFEVLPAGTPAATQTPVTNGGMSVGVGASFALDVVDMVVEAGIGKSRPVSAGSASITAEGRHYRETVSVAGTDPISGENASGVSDGTTGSTGGTTGGTGTTSQTTVKPKDISVDASVAIGLSDIAIKSYLSNGASVTTTGKSGDGDFTTAAVSKGYTLT